MGRFMASVLCAFFFGCGTEPSTGDTDDSVDTDVPVEDTDVDEVVESFVEGRECPPDSILSYENFGEAFMLRYCAGCHGEAVAEGERAGAPIDVNLSSHADVQDWLQRVYARSADDNVSMPVVDTVTAEERTRLGDWLACGAP